MLEDLDRRGLIHDSTDREALDARLGEGPITLYCGFDPTAESLHLGNLFPLLVLRRFQEQGHRPIALAGGATGMVGDPGGRSTERPLMDSATLDRNLAAVKDQLGRLIDFDGGDTAALLVDNREWTAPIGLLDFLRDVGKHATVNQMMARDSVRNRLDSAEGISFTEFSYMLLQANDYWWLHEHHRCELQVGGSDQWGNITSGIDLIRRRSGATVHGLTVPLFTRHDGTKFGKSEGENIWLDADRTSPYRMYQYLIGVDDDDVGRLLAQLTLEPFDEISHVHARHAEAPEARQAQRLLARSTTALVHGSAEATRAERASAVLFGGSDADLSAGALETLVDEVPTSRQHRDAANDLVVLLVATDLVTSKSDARRALEDGSIAVNGAKVAADDRVSFIHDRFLLVRRGKKRHHLVVADNRRPPTADRGGS